MIHFLNKPDRQKLCNLLADGPTLLLIKVTQALLNQLRAWPDLQGMLGDFPRNAWHIRGFPRKDASVCEEEVDERAFLFGGERGANAHHLALGAVGVYEDLLCALCGLKRPGRPLGVRRFLDDPLLDDRELLEGDNHRGMLTALNLALVSTLEGGNDGDDPSWAWHLKLEVGVVGDGHELCVARAP